MAVAALELAVVAGTTIYQQHEANKTKEEQAAAMNANKPPSQQPQADEGALTAQGQNRTLSATGRTGTNLGVPGMAGSAIPGFSSAPYPTMVRPAAVGA